MKNKLIGIIAFVAVIGFSFTACEEEDDTKTPVASETPVASDYTFGNLKQIAGDVKAITITPKDGKSTGAVSNIKYAGNTTIPQTYGTYSITFDVAEATGWNAATNLTAGNLVVVSEPYWTAVTDTTFFGSNTTFYAVTYGNNKFVAVGFQYNQSTWGDGHCIMAYSNDGVTWTEVTDTTFDKYYDRIYAIAYGNGKFVAGGTGGKIEYSTDGVTWTAVDNVKLFEYSYYSDGAIYTDKGKIGAITYGNNKFVAVGDRSRKAYSTDGVTWTAVTKVSTDCFIRAIAYGNGKFVAGGSDGGIEYSTDGVTWTTDGVTWTTVEGTSEYGGYIYTIAYGNGKFVANSGRGGKTAYSTDGVTWTEISNNTLHNYEDFHSGVHIYAIAYGNNKFFAASNTEIDSDAKMAYSSDGVTWTAVTDTTFGISFIMAIAYGNGKFVALGSRGKIAYSTGY